MRLKDINKKEILNDETIASATDSKGNVSRAKADKIADPKGYFEKNKRQLKKSHRWFMKSA
jgi:hypothetical protein